MEVLSERNRVARKEHQCNLCGGIIKKGERYNIQTVAEDHLYDFKSHISCEKMIHILDMTKDIESDRGVNCELFEGDIYEEFHRLFPNNNEDISFHQVLEKVKNHYLNKKESILKVKELVETFMCSMSKDMKNYLITSQKSTEIFNSEKYDYILQLSNMATELSILMVEIKYNGDICFFHGSEKINKDLKEEILKIDNTFNITEYKK